MPEVCALCVSVRVLCFARVMLRAYRCFSRAAMRPAALQCACYAARLSQPLGRLYSYVPYSYGLYSCGLHSHGATLRACLSLLGGYVIIAYIVMFYKVMANTAMTYAGKVLRCMPCSASSAVI